jgi:DNA-binding NarL/FixJ family response regulator
LSYELGGTSRLVFSSKGVRCRLDIPAKWLAADGMEQAKELRPSKAALAPKKNKPMEISLCAEQPSCIASTVRKRDRRRASGELTQRELAVLRFASDGKAMEEIASALGLCMETVRSHFKTARKKLRARNRTHAVAVAMRQLSIA